MATATAAAPKPAQAPPLLLEKKLLVDIYLKLPESAVSRHGFDPRAGAPAVVPLAHLDRRQQPDERLGLKAHVEGSSDVVVLGDELGHEHASRGGLDPEAA